MPDLPARFAELILAFAPLFVHRSWRHAEVLLIGAILNPSRRTVTSVLRIMGRAQERPGIVAKRRGKAEEVAAAVVFLFSETCKLHHWRIPAHRRRIHHEHVHLKAQVLSRSGTLDVKSK